MHRWAFVFPLLALASVGCARGVSQKTADRNLYAREAYLEQQAEIEDSEWQRLDQVREDDLVIQVKKNPNKRWERLPYETIDTWQERIFEVIRVQNDEILQLQEALSLIETEEHRLVNTIQQYRQTNEQLRQILETHTQEETQVAEEAQLQMVNSNMERPAFFIHLVRPGDTLYSIAMGYYGDKERVGDLLRWNQRWIRNEFEVPAGLSLILFEADAPVTNPQLVETYIDHLEVPR